MNLLFDINHPAHVHLLRNFISYLKEKEHSVHVVSRDKDVTNLLLKYYGIEYTCLSTAKTSFFGMCIELACRDYRILRMHHQVRFDLAFGTSVSIAHLTALTSVPSYNLEEDDDSSIPLITLLTCPFTTKVINPTCIRYNLWRKKRVFVPSYHELAYLHPNNFSPDRTVIDKYGLKEKDYILARFSALKAHHDIGQKGISNDLWKKIQKMCFGYEIVISAENNVSHQIDPWDLHHVLAFSKLLISDSQTMTIEGSVLGIPSVKINSFKDMSSVIQELESKYKLSLGYLPQEEAEILNTINKLLINDDTESIWAKRREKMLEDKVDYNQWLIEFFEKGLMGHA